MTTNELASRIEILQTGYGHWKITDNKTGKTGTSTNSEAIDRISDTDLMPTQRSHYDMTLKQAYIALFSATAVVK